MDTVLVKTQQYNGRYVALSGPENGKVVGAGSTPEKALRAARKNGVDDAYIVFVPAEDTINIY